MRRWLDDHAGGSPPWPSHLQGPAPLLKNLEMERPQVLDRYHQHVRHCKHCSDALARTRRIAALAAVVSVAAAVAAVVSVAAPAAAQAGVVPAVVAWALGVVGVGPLVGVGVVALLVRAAAKALEYQFTGFVDYDRKPFAPSA